jgi:DNA-binding transcriptional MerR regulator
MIVGMRDNGASLREIGTVVDLTAEAVRQVLLRAGPIGVAANLSAKRKLAIAKLSNVSRSAKAIERRIAFLTRKVDEITHEIDEVNKE